MNSRSIKSEDKISSYIQDSRFPFHQEQSTEQFRQRLYRNNTSTLTSESRPHDTPGTQEDGEIRREIRRGLNYEDKRRTESRDDNYREASLAVRWRSDNLCGTTVTDNEPETQLMWRT